MPRRIEVGLNAGLFDAQGHIDSQRIQNALGLDVDVEYVKVYTEDLELTPEEVGRFSEELRHPLVNTSSVNASTNPVDEQNDHVYVIEVGYKPGVMDPEGRSAKLLAEMVYKRQIPFDRKVVVQHQRRIRSKNPLTETQLKKIAGLFYNPTVQNYRLFSASDLTDGIQPYMPEVRLPAPEPIRHYDMNTTDPDLLKLSNKRVLALDQAEMKAIQVKYNDQKFIEARRKVGLGEKATDGELEIAGQTWSEHCRHKIFNAAVTYTEGGKTEIFEEGIFTEFIKKPTLALQQQKPGLIKSVLWDNSGVVDFDPESGHYVCFKCETHNSPSFIEPYGGAITGIVGVYRDPLGTGRGSKLIFGVWGYCTGSTFYDGDLKPPLHPDQLLDGIHHGVRDGANKHGVPTAIGNAFFDDSYLGKCLVHVGAAGAIPKEVAGRPGYEKWINPGDKCVVVGGRVGKDGIHGATGSSQEFSEHTPAGHVQIGDPYTQKNVQEFMLEALEEGLINFAQDSGAGGTASAAGEMAQYSKGARLDLSKDLLKYEGLASWEKLVSESQERMFLAVSPENMERIAVLAKKWSVDYRDIGEFNDTGYFHVVDDKEPLVYVDLDFLHKGTPRKNLNAVWQTPEERGLAEPDQGFYETVMQQDPATLLNNILRGENVASREFLQREYDNRVQGRTVIPAFIGEKGDVPSDAFVQLLEYDRDTGVACGIGLNPSYSKIDTYDMAMMAANEGLMRVVAVGADPDSAVNNGNYCWPGVLPDESDESEYKMAQLVRAAKAQRDFALTTGVATVSGKDSMKIQGNIETADGGRRRVYGLPSIQFATIAPVHDVNKCVTSDFKAAGDVIYIAGAVTRDELGGSELYQRFGQTGRNAPKVDAQESIDICRRLHSAMKDEFVESAKVCSKGGLAVALSYSAMGGGLGASVDLASIRRDFDDEERTNLKLQYSETASRFLVTVRPEYAKHFEQVMSGYAQQIGYVTDSGLSMRGIDGKAFIGTDFTELKKSWQSTFSHKNYHGDEISQQ
ncbi:MAG: AIR synthase-related protein [Candidatus Aenigmatarchaeota archaeon]